MNKIISKVLIVIDMQNDFITGSLGSTQAQAIVPNVIAKIQEYHKNNHQIFFTRDTHDKNYLSTSEGKALPVEHCIIGTDGWLIHPDILSCIALFRKGKLIYKPTFIDKPTFGYKWWIGDFYGPHLGDYEIELVGLCTGICVVTNALILKTEFPSSKIIVDASCCACISEETHKAALLTMKTCQINVINE
jgi:nicotinamidase-related amidase